MSHRILAARRLATPPHPARDTGMSRCYSGGPMNPTSPRSNTASHDDHPEVSAANARAGLVLFFVYLAFYFQNDAQSLPPRFHRERAKTHRIFDKRSVLSSL